MDLLGFARIGPSRRSLGEGGSARLRPGKVEFGGAWIFGVFSHSSFVLGHSADAAGLIWFILMASPASDFSLAFSQISNFKFSLLGVLGALAVKNFYFF
ncbi:MAG TPA: hypothetical protein VK815_07960 [Candidatus Acidoferrales bacterium]|nr:hypothetical protein [Candidatus Acidoferrales bacterium]